jgi:hypothetical protein
MSLPYLCAVSKRTEGVVGVVGIQKRDAIVLCCTAQIILDIFFRLV